MGYLAVVFALIGVGMTIFEAAASQHTITPMIAFVIAVALGIVCAGVEGAQIGLYRRFYQKQLNEI